MALPVPKDDRGLPSPEVAPKSSPGVAPRPIAPRSDWPIVPNLEPLLIFPGLLTNAVPLGPSVPNDTTPLTIGGDFPPTPLSRSDRRCGRLPNPGLATIALLRQRYTAFGGLEESQSWPGVIPGCPASVPPKILLEVSGGSEDPKLSLKAFDSPPQDDRPGSLAAR